MKQFKCRCSAIGTMMTNPRAKKDQENGVLSATTKTYVQDWLKSVLYDREKQFSSKYTDKGIAKEAEAIQVMAKQLGLNLKKNTERFENEWITGEPDVMVFKEVPESLKKQSSIFELLPQSPDTIIDVKCPWSVWSFPTFAQTVPSKAYWWQGQGYMWLADTRHYRLAYCLMDAPDDLIAQEFKKRTWDIEGEEKAEILDQIVKEMTFGDISDKLKIKTFEFERDDEAIEQIKERVKQCREYQGELLSLINY
jgi:hypothetical protein